MIVVDSSAWISYLRGGEGCESAQLLDEMINSDEDIYLVGPILTEVLQGIRTDTAFHKTKEYLREFPCIIPQDDDYVIAAEIYRKGRSQGITIRSSMDCIIAAVCSRRSIPILHCDKDFEKIAELTNLEILIPQSKH